MQASGGCFEDILLPKMEWVEFMEICAENEKQRWIHLEMKLQTPMSMVPENDVSKWYEAWFNGKD